MKKGGNDFNPRDAALTYALWVLEEFNRVIRESPQAQDILTDVGREAWQESVRLLESWERSVEKVPGQLKKKIFQLANCVAALSLVLEDGQDTLRAESSPDAVGKYLKDSGLDYLARTHQLSKVSEHTLH